MAARAATTEGALGSPHPGVIRPLRPYVMADEPASPSPAPSPAPAAEPVPGPVPVPSAPPAPAPTAAPVPVPAPVGSGPPDQLPSDRSSLAVRPFLLTAGRVAGARARSGAGGDAPPLPLETQVVATAEGLAALDDLTFEHQAIVAACRVPQSLAELAARLRLHLNVVRVIADDLRTAGQLAVYAPQASTAQDVSVLRRVIDGLRAVPDSRGLPRDNGPV